MSERNNESKRAANHKVPSGQCARNSRRSISLVSRVASARRVLAAAVAASEYHLRERMEVCKQKRGLHSHCSERAARQANAPSARTPSAQDESERNKAFDWV